MTTASGSVAPKERINIKYVPATGDQKAEIELPLKMLVMGDFKGQADARALELRPLVSINRETFNEVLNKADVHLSLSVPSMLGDDDETLTFDLQFASIHDFGPDAIARHVPELNKLLDLRAALVALKGPMGNTPAFRKSLQGLLGNTQDRQRLATELGIPPATATE